MATDQADVIGYKLRFPAGRLEEYLVGLIIAAQLSLGIMAFLVFVLWFHAAPSPNTGYMYPEILALSVGMGVVAYLLKYLYRGEDLEE